MVLIKTLTDGVNNFCKNDARILKFVRFLKYRFLKFELNLKLATMFEYSNEILTKVSFDKDLFRKELLKAIKWLTADERKLLMIWCFATFHDRYGAVITQAFKQVIR